jgi:hypothetical protein
VVADGVFDSARGREYLGAKAEGLMDTEEMAEAYWKLHTQGKRAWSWEIDLRPYLVWPPAMCLSFSSESGIRDWFCRRSGKFGGVRLGGMAGKSMYYAIQLLVEHIWLAVLDIWSIYA